MEDKVEKDRAALAKERTAFERSLRPPHTNTLMALAHALIIVCVLSQGEEAASKEAS